MYKLCEKICIRNVVISRVVECQFLIKKISMLKLGKK